MIEESESRPVQEQPGPQKRGLPIRSNLRAGIVVQVDIPSISTIQQVAETPVAAVPVTPAVA